jgi:flagellar hook-associated protein 1 FlgK
MFFNYLRRFLALARRLRMSLRSRGRMFGSATGAKTMSLSAALNSSLSSMLALQQQTRVASGNVANAQTPDYTRKNVNLTTPASQGLPSGVSILSITRTVSTALQNDLISRTADQSAEAVRARYMGDIGGLLDVKNGQPAITKQLQAFQQAWTDFEANPENPNLARAIANQGQQLATSLNRLAAEPSRIDSRIASDIDTAVTDLNSLIRNAYELNTQIVTQASTGEPVGELQDKLDTIIRQISSYTKVQMLPTGTGAIQILTTGGQSLVSAATPPVFSFDSLTNQLRVTNGASTTNVQSTAFQSGQIDALLRMRAGYADTTTTSQAIMTSSAPTDGTLRKFMNQIDTMANQLVGVVNTAYNKSNSFGTELAANFFTFSTLAAPPATTVATNVAQGKATTASTGGSLTDTGAAFGAFAPTPALFHRVTIVSGQGAGSSAIITASTATSITAPGLAATDATSVYQIQSVTGPLMAGTTTAATTTTITDTNNAWNVNQFAPTASGIEYQVRITSGAGAGQIGRIVSNTGNAITVNPPFSAAPGANSTYVIEPALRNVPSAASMLQVNPSVVGGTTTVSKGSTAAVKQALSSSSAAAFDTVPIAAASLASLSNSGIIQGQLTTANVFASVISYTSQSIATVAKAETDAETLRHQTEQSYRNQVGVSVDTEMSNLIVLQNAYQASAQVLQTVRTMFDTLINLGRN